MTSVRAYIGLGSNLGDSCAILNEAVAAIAEMPHTQIDSVSPYYRSAPMGPQDQPDYLNAVLALNTLFAPEQLLDYLQQLEQGAGRERTVNWGPRTLDLDILFYGDLTVSTQRLQLPHPGVLLRNFVLLPLRDVLKQLGAQAPHNINITNQLDIVGSDDIERYAQ